MYKTFQRQVCEAKPHVFNSERLPTISEKTFRQYCCKCVGDPTTASCVDVIFDKVLNFAEALNDFFLDNHYCLLKEDEAMQPCRTTLGRTSIFCDCVECKEGKPSWLKIFNPEKSSVSLIDDLLRIVMCPKTEEEDLTLPEDEWKHKQYGWNCAHENCDMCGIDRLPWDCPILSQNESM